MSERAPDFEFELGEGVDAYLEMLQRRRLNDLVPNPRNFYRDSLQTLYFLNQEEVFQRPFKSSDMVLDIGCSSGEFLVDAANDISKDIGFRCQNLVGVDPQSGPYRLLLSQPDGEQRFKYFEFRQGIGENLPLESASAKVIMAHNSLFRGDPRAILIESRRVGTPDALFEFSTNDSDNGKLRHNLEWLTGKSVERILRESYGLNLDLWKLRLPADYFFAEDVDDLLAETGFVIIEEALQDESNEINWENFLMLFLPAIQNAVKSTEVPPDLYWLWRQQAKKIVPPKIAKLIFDNAQKRGKVPRAFLDSRANIIYQPAASFEDLDQVMVELQGVAIEMELKGRDFPHFNDIVHRRLFVCQKR